MDWTGKIVLITGASAGIGEATARAVYARGAVPVLAARRGDLLLKLADELPGSMPVVVDVTTPDGPGAMVTAALAAHGRVDVLVNNAGQGLHVPLDQVVLDDFRAVLELNVVAALGVMQAVLPAMRAQGGGVIVNVSSGTSRRTIPGLGAYASTKAALNMLSAVAREEWAPDGIVVSNVYPTLTATDFHENLRAGAFDTGSRPPMAADTAENVAQVIVETVENGDAERVLTPGLR
jgi:NADP-dependent 3-hydroxy acid dehydrogenase YdfG